MSLAPNNFKLTLDWWDKAKMMIIVMMMIEGIAAINEVLFRHNSFHNTPPKRKLTIMSFLSDQIHRNLYDIISKFKQN